MPKVSSSCILRDYGQTFTQRVSAQIIQQGPMPRHIGIIMDGNRRYAKRNKFRNATEGHKMGEHKLLEVTNMFLDLGIEECTMYSLSVDNLKRTPSEVKGILDITINRMEAILAGSDELRERGIRWNVVGNWEKIPSSRIKTLFAKTCKVSKENKTLTLHLAFAYSAHRQICEGISNLVDGLQNESLLVNDITEELLQNSVNLHETHHPVDILIRTGGDSRLSDFLLWQASTAYLEIIPLTWPEFGFWDLLKAVFRYQRQVVFEGLLIHKPEVVTQLADEEKKRQSLFLEKLRAHKWDFIDSMIRQ